VSAAPAQTEFVAVGPSEGLTEGTLRVFPYRDTRVAVCRAGGALYAIEDLCTHDDGPLGEGTLRGDEVECPRHGARFSVKTGAALSMPAVAPVRVFEAREEGGRVLVRPKA
jgi:3-phenylpropionate/trans-cinnamate dioxygenase ferredoxin subunit